MEARCGRARGDAPRMADRKVAVQHRAVAPGHGTRGGTGCRWAGGTGEGLSASHDVKAVRSLLAPRRGAARMARLGRMGSPVVSPPAHFFRATGLSRIHHP